MQWKRIKDYASALGLVAIGAVLGALIWYSISPGQQQGEGPVPVIRADSSDYKKIPEDRGGMEIQHKDSTIFNVLKAENNDRAGRANQTARESGDGRVENLFAEGDQPDRRDRDAYFADRQDALTPDQLARLDEDTARRVAESMERPGDSPGNISGDEQEKPGAGTADQAGATNIRMEDAKEQAAQDGEGNQDRAGDDSGSGATANSPLPGFKPRKKEVLMRKDGTESGTGENHDQTLDFVRSVLDKKDRDGTKRDSAGRDDAAKSPGTRKPVGNHFIQLASLSSREGAEKQWKVLQKKYPDLLKGLNLDIQKKDLGARGTYYRVRGGPLTAGKAKSLCRQIRERQGGGCLVVSG